jgi:hypothetical protein
LLHQNASHLTHRERVNNNDKKRSKTDWEGKTILNWCKFNGYSIKSLYIIAENQRISENVDFNKHQVD